MYRFLILLVAAMSCFAHSLAANVARVTINGEPVTKAVTAISFNGDRITVHFGDSDATEADMEAVTLSFVDDGFSAIDAASSLSVFNYDGVVGDLLTVSGLQEQTSVTLLDVSGKSVLGPIPAESRMEINVAHLPVGVYVLRAGRDVVKFTKR